MKSAIIIDFAAYQQKSEAKAQLKQHSENTLPSEELAIAIQQLIQRMRESNRSNAN